LLTTLLVLIMYVISLGVMSIEPFVVEKHDDMLSLKYNLWSISIAICIALLSLFNTITTLFTKVVKWSDAFESLESRKITYLFKDASKSFSCESNKSIIDYFLKMRDELSKLGLVNDEVSDISDMDLFDESKLQRTISNFEINQIFLKHLDSLDKTLHLSVQEFVEVRKNTNVDGNQLFYNFYQLQAELGIVLGGDLTRLLVRAKIKEFFSLKISTFSKAIYLVEYRNKDTDKEVTQDQLESMEKFLRWLLPCRNQSMDLQNEFSTLAKTRFFLYEDKCKAIDEMIALFFTYKNRGNY
jgi:hypothetical protein